jgi:hypothetical protein
MSRLLVLVLSLAGCSGGADFSATGGEAGSDSGGSETVAGSAGAPQAGSEAAGGSEANAGSGSNGPAGASTGGRDEGGAGGATTAGVGGQAFSGSAAIAGAGGSSAGSAGEPASGGSPSAEGGAGGAGPDDPLCVCDSGPCCDGCQFRPKSHFCGEVIRSSTCRPDGIRIEHDYWNLFCSGTESAECTRWGGHTKYVAPECSEGLICTGPDGFAECITP